MRILPGIASALLLIPLLSGPASWAAGPEPLHQPPSPAYAPIGFLPQLQPDEAKAELGKRIFFDPRLSADEQTACAQCHRPQEGYAAATPLSPGNRAGGGFRNVPSLINSAHKTRWGWDGRHDSLTAMIGEMFSDPYTMNMDPELMTARMNQDPDYVRLFREAGFSAPSSPQAWQAVAEYLKRLTSKNAPLDTGQLSDAAKRGRDLFAGAAGCIRCHHGPMLSDGQAHNLGLPGNPAIFNDPHNHQTLLAYAQRHQLEDPAERNEDPGRAAISKNQQDRGAFITPSLRELNHSGPYMHNGTFSSLAEVVEFYYFGGGRHAHKSELLQPLQISLEEMNDLITFLESLSGRALTSAPYLWTLPYPKEYPSVRYWTERPGQ